MSRLHFFSMIFCMKKSDQVCFDNIISLLSNSIKHLDMLVHAQQVIPPNVVMITFVIFKMVRTLI